MRKTQEAVVVGPIVHHSMLDWIKGLAVWAVVKADESLGFLGGIGAWVLGQTMLEDATIAAETSWIMQLLGAAVLGAAGAFGGHIGGLAYRTLATHIGKRLAQNSQKKLKDQEPPAPGRLP